MSQKHELLQWLKREPITPIQALAHIGIFRLASRINDLRNDGNVISTELIDIHGGRRVARYTLVRTCLING